jgi:hypothetical protein
VIDVLRRERAGRSAERRYKDLARSWRRRVFGRRFGLYFWTIYALLLVLVVDHRGGRWPLYAGFVFGAAAASWRVLPEALMPAHISNWQRGAWGEQNTGSELKKLSREGWTIRHDLRWGVRWNHDHVAAAGAVFVLNSKHLIDSAVTVEDKGLRVSRLDGDDSYVADRWLPSIEVEARSLKSELATRLGFPVHVYPVVVIWGVFEPEQQYVGEVSVVRGDKLVEWLRSRPTDLPSAEKRQAVARAVCKLPRAPVAPES